MKNHKFWAWAMVFCMIMVIYTGYEHKLQRKGPGSGPSLLP